MSNSRNGSRAVAAVLAGERPYSARSVLASTLLGIDPPRLPARLLVRTGELFGIAEGTVRVAVSRMVAAGELVADDGHYRLSGKLLGRQARQSLSRSGRRGPWDGQTWRTEIVLAGTPRSATERGELRTAMEALRLAEWREGVWLRPDNLPSHGLCAGPAGQTERTVRRQCRRLDAVPADEPAALAAELWDLDGWSERAHLLHDALGELVDVLEAGDASALSPGFVVSAACLRHFQIDPLLPPELLPSGWPGGSLRADYERYDRAFKSAWRANFR